MKAFTYGIEDRKMDAIRWHFGKAEYMDTTPQYQDILATCADIVIVAVDHTADAILHIIKEYQSETAEEDDTEYYYISDAEIDMWCREYYEELEDVIHTLGDDVTPEEFEALHLFGIQSLHNGIISRVVNKEDGNVKLYDFYRSDVGEKELLVLSFGNNLIDASVYHSFEEEYDIVSAACYKEIQSRTSCLRELFEYRVATEVLPSVLQELNRRLVNVTEPFVYAYFGE